jgi:hypothetical protein
VLQNFDVGSSMQYALGKRLSLLVLPEISCTTIFSSVANLRNNCYVQLPLEEFCNQNYKVVATLSYIE